MTPRALIGIAVSVIAAVVLCGAGIGGMFFGGGAGGGLACTMPSGAASPVATISAPPPGGAWPKVGRFDAEQVGHAATIVAVGAHLGVAPRGWVIALATAIQESDLRNPPGGPDDSIGLFQQRPSQGWGTPAQLADPTYAATKFFQALLKVPGWQTMALTDAAQAVQHSAFPGAYAKREPEASMLASALTGAVADCSAEVGPQGWVAPVRAPIVSGFRTPERPTHDGDDLGAPRGTPIHAASSGVVSRVRCNAIDADTGADWGCDRDGDPVHTRGCGWYVDIDHPGGIVTRYCHMLTHPAVAEGQPVVAGQVIGVVGSSGHSCGPHLHYEVHLGDHTSATAVDPAPFMAAHQAPLGQ
jgi:murein DD-endopeptidase MepM/ murein hydrolase activator NlpD